MANRNTLLSLEILGSRGLEAALLALGQDRLIKNTMRRALLTSARPVVVAAQMYATRHTGRMANKIAASSTLARRQRRGAKYRRHPTEAHVFIGAGPRGPGVLTEFGTGPRYHRKSGKFVGAAPAQPFMRPAWEGGKRQVLDSYQRQLWTQIEKSAKRLARRQAKAAGIQL